MNKKVKSVVAYGTAPWRSALPILRLVGPAERAGIQVIYGNNGPVVDPNKVSEADIVVIQRDFPRFALPFGQVLHLARKQQKPVIYEVDDLLFELPEGHVSKPDLSILHLAMFWAMAEADAITVSTPYLQDILRIFNPHISLLPNYLNDDLWTFSTPHKANDEGDTVVIGYMGGQTHSEDLKYVLPALERIFSIYGSRISLFIWGGEPPGELRVHPQVSWTPLDIQDYAEFARLFSSQSCDIFISPLLDNRFNKAKSAIKFLEYSALGVPGVYSRLEPYEGIVEDGKNGFLASSMDEWVLALQTLIEDQHLRLKLGRSAQYTTQQRFLLSQHAGEWETVYQQVLSRVRECSIDDIERIAVVSKAVQQSLEHYNQLERENVTLFEGLSLKTAELDEIVQSKSWRMVGKAQLFRKRLVPVGSRREIFLQKLGIK